MNNFIGELKPVVSVNVSLSKINIFILTFLCSMDKLIRGLVSSLFDSLAHNNDLLSNIEKFQYIKLYLQRDVTSSFANY